ncbi:hypothetical protein [Roseateles sp. P5_E7]
MLNRRYFLLALFFWGASALAQAPASPADCASCAEVHRVLGLMERVIKADVPTRTAQMMRLIQAELAAVCRDDPPNQEVVCDIAGSQPGERLSLAMYTDDDRRMAAERRHFLWVRMQFHAPRPERMRELGEQLGPGWRRMHSGQGDCYYGAWRRGPVANTFTRVEISGRWRDTAGCEDRVTGVDLVITKGDYPMPRIH